MVDSVGSISLVSSKALDLVSPDSLMKKNFHEVELIGYVLDGWDRGSATELKMQLFKQQYQWRRLFQAGSPGMGYFGLQLFDTFINDEADDPCPLLG